MALYWKTHLCCLFQLHVCFFFFFSSMFLSSTWQSCSQTSFWPLPLSSTSFVKNHSHLDHSPLVHQSAAWRLWPLLPIHYVMCKYTTHSFCLFQWQWPLPCCIFYPIKLLWLVYTTTHGYSLCYKNWTKYFPCVWIII